MVFECSDRIDMYVDCLALLPMLPYDSEPEREDFVLLSLDLARGTQTQKPLELLLFYEDRLAKMFY